MPCSLWKTRFTWLAASLPAALAERGGPVHATPPLSSPAQPLPDGIAPDRDAGHGPVLAIRAKSLLPLTGEEPARGARLFAPLKRVDNAVLVVRHGLVEAVGRWGSTPLPPGALVRDVGPVCLAPACVNAHTHLELSHLAGRTRWEAGFTAWLQSLIPLLSPPQDAAAASAVVAAAEAACADMAAMGTRCVGNVAGSLPHGILVADAASRAAGLTVSHFCEWFGFGPPFAQGEAPGRRAAARPLEEDPFLAARCAPADTPSAPPGRTCWQTATKLPPHGAGIFLPLGGIAGGNAAAHGRRGAPAGLLCGVVLPPDWRAPGLRPLAYALRLGLLCAGTLAVHGVQLDQQEVEVLAASGAALCLCPRSNRRLDVGLAPVRELMESGCLLCLGTDGLTSNRDLDVRQEAAWLRETLDVPPEALVRLLTVNGVAALNLQASGAGRLEPGAPADFCVLPEALVY